MAYDKAKIEAQIIEVVKSEKITFFTDLEAFIEPSIAVLYQWEFEKLETIKREIAKNRIESKKKMRRNWEASENPTLQIAAYKLIAEDDELQKLSNKHEVTGDKGAPIQTVNKHIVEFHDCTGENDKTEL
jgi:hypothetical protein